MGAKRGLAGQSDVTRAVERQLSNWELGRTQRPTLPLAARPEIDEFVCLSRMVGIETQQIVTRLGARLGWPIFDREVLERMAGDDEVRRRLYLAMNERDLSWWETAMSPLVVGKAVTDDYFRRLCEAVVALARQGSCIFVGRGAELILPRDRGLRVRIVASPATVRRAVAHQRDLTEHEASAWIEREEAARERFFRRHFRSTPSDPERYDLTLNLDHLDGDEVVELIVAARELKRRRAVAASA